MSLNPRQIKTFGLVCLLSVAGCSTTKGEPTFLSQVRTDVFGEKRSDEEKAWGDLLRNSDFKQVSHDRLIIEAWAAPNTGMDAVEQRLLARAAAEARSLGFDRFVILHIRDRNLPTAGALNTISIFGADEYEIGSYEALVRSRYERDYSAAPRTWVRPGVTAIVKMMTAEQAAEYDETFDAVSLYEFLNRKEMAK